MHKYACAAVVAAAFMVTTRVCAASTVDLRGEVSNGGAVNPLVIDLYDEHHHRVCSTIVAADGSFHFANLEAGNYELQVVDRGNLIGREYVNAQHGLPPLTIRITAPANASRPNPAGPISITRLRHKVPGKAQKLFRRGSLEDLEQAVALDADYMEAQNNLGCKYLERGDYSRALEHLERAAHLDPLPMTYTNLAIALVQLSRFTDALAAVQHAMREGDASSKTKYVFAIVLMRLGRPSPEYMPPLVAASEDFAPARRVLALIEAQNARNAAATSHPASPD